MVTLDTGNRTVRAWSLWTQGTRNNFLHLHPGNRFVFLFVTAAVSAVFVIVVAVVVVRGILVVVLLFSMIN